MNMSYETSSPEFHRKNRFEKDLHKSAPQVYIPQYSMVTFTNIPYHIARDKGDAQLAKIDELYAMFKKLFRVYDLPEQKRPKKITNFLKMMYFVLDSGFIKL